MNFAPLDTVTTGTALAPVPGRQGLFRSPAGVFYDSRRYRVMNGRLWRVVGGTNASPTLMTVPEIDQLQSADLGGLGDLAPRDVLAVQSEQANAAVTLLSRLASGGAAGVLARPISDWQSSWNRRLTNLQAAARALGQPALADAMRRLAVDGYWGPATTFTTAIWISTSAPPSRLADVPAWWRTHSAGIAQRRDAIAEAYRLAMASPTAPAPAPSTPTPSPTPPAPAPAPAPSAPAPVVPYDATERRNAGTSASGGTGGSSSSMLLLAVAVVGIGAVVAFRGEKSGLSELEAPKSESLWRYNRRSGLWDHQRTVTEDTAASWLAKFRSDEPNETFVIAKHAPKKPPPRNLR